MLRRHVNKASVDELSVYRRRLTESDASELDHGCGCRGDGLAGVGRRVRRAGARGVLGWEEGRLPCVRGTQKGLFFSRNADYNIHDLEVSVISSFWLAEGSWTGSGVSCEF